MSHYNSQFFLNIYSGVTGTNSPQLSHVKWDRTFQGIPCEKPVSQEYALAPLQSQTLFDGSVSIAQDNTTEYTIQPSTTNIGAWSLSRSAGTKPNFRTPRTTGADATTQIQVTLNGTIAIFTSIGGTALNLISGGVVVGDYVFLPNTNVFSPLNVGYYQVIAVTATSFSVINPNATAETKILGASFASEIQIFSAAGVQKTDTLNIISGFSPVILGSYPIVQVYANSIDFFSAEPLPTQTATGQLVQFYSNARNLIYIETDQKLQLTINGTLAAQVEPRVANGIPIVGQYFQTSDIYSLSVQNMGLNPANVLLIALE